MNKRNSFILLLIFFISNLVIMSISLGGSTQTITTIDQNDGSTQKIAEISYHESAWTHINPAGDIWSEVQFEGPNVQLGGINMEIIKDLHGTIYEHFWWGNWDFTKPNGPDDFNSWIELAFVTDNSEQAREWAQWLMGFVNDFLIVEFQEQHINGWDEYIDNKWQVVTSVGYQAHIDWPFFTETFNNSIPRDIGGLAETLDITNADHLKMWMWKGDTNIYQSLGVAWSHQVEKLSGTFSYSIKDFIDVTDLQKAPDADGLHLSFSLPDVENVTANPAGATINYHPNVEEPWNKHNYYDVSLEVSTSVDDFNITFDGTFVPWDKQPREQASIDVIPYGYALQRLHINHANASFFDWESQFTAPKN